MRILLFEDQPDTLELTTRILRHIGHTVVGFPNGEKIIEYCDTGAGFDLLISDIGLPGQNGMQVLAKLRSRCQPFKAIAMTAYARDVEIAQCRAAGVHNQAFFAGRAEGRDCAGLPRGHMKDLSNAGRRSARKQ